MTVNLKDMFLETANFARRSAGAAKTFEFIRKKAISTQKRGDNCIRSCKLSQKKQLIIIFK